MHMGECMHKKVATYVAMLYTFIANLCIPSNASDAKLRYTIVYNTSRAVRFQQVYFGSLNKPDGRTGMLCTNPW